jgi:hypothetical protein
MAMTIHDYQKKETAELNTLQKLFEDKTTAQATAQTARQAADKYKVERDSHDADALLAKAAGRSNGKGTIDYDKLIAESEQAAVIAERRVTTLQTACERQRQVIAGIHSEIEAHAFQAYVESNAERFVEIRELVNRLIDLTDAVWRSSLEHKLGNVIVDRVCWPLGVDGSGPNSTPRQERSVIMSACWRLGLAREMDNYRTIPASIDPLKTKKAPQ